MQGQSNNLMRVFSRQKGSNVERISSRFDNSYTFIVSRFAQAIRSR